jgi:hypothetical protein
MKSGLDESTAGKADPGLLANPALEAERAGWDWFFLWDMMYVE